MQSYYSFHMFLIKKLSLGFAMFMSLLFPMLAHAQTADLGLQPLSVEAGFGNSSASGLESVLASLGIILFIALVPLVAIFVFAVIALMKIAKKTNTPNGWLVIIFPVIPFKIAKFAGLSYWWGLLAYLPLLSFDVEALVFLFSLTSVAFSTYLWMRISKRLGFSQWLGLVMILPIANLVLLGYLAFAQPQSQAQQSQIA